MSAGPLVSVILPTHGRAELLGRALRSVLAQTVADLEVLVVDDGSTDATATVLQEAARADARVRAHAHARPEGPPAARNTGLDNATGRYIAFLDDDDEWLPTKLERQIQVLDDVPSVVLVGCHHVEVHDSGQAVTHRGPVRCSRGELLWSNFVGSTSLGLVRRSALPGGELPRFDPSLPSCQDWDYWVTCAGSGDVAVVAETLCRYSAASGDRVTTDPAKRLAGHERFAAKHAAAMSPDCRSFLAARRRLLAAGSQVREVLLGPRLLASTRPRASWVLANEIVASRAGARVGDPARGARRLHQLIEGRP